MKRLSIKKFLTSIFEEETITLTDAARQGFREHFGLEVFEANPHYKKFSQGILSIKSTGNFTTHVAGDEVLAKTGEFSCTTGKRVVTSVIFDAKEDPLPSRYLEIREEGHMTGIGNVWDVFAEKKLVFMLEEPKDAGVDFPVVTVLKTTGSALQMAEFFTLEGTWLGRLDVRAQKDAIRYSACLSRLLLGEKSSEFTSATFATKKQVEFPLYHTQSLYKKSPQTFKSVEPIAAQRLSLTPLKATIQEK